jgi:ferredoxin
MLGMFKAMRQTMSHLPKKKLTVQYPEQREALPARSRGLFRVAIDPASGVPTCRSCTLCESNCPVQVIRVNHTSKYKLPAPNVARISEARIAAQQGIDPQALQPVLDDYYEHGTGLIAMLQNAQEIYGYLPRTAIQEISLQTGVSLSQIYGVSSFYNQFRLSPVGELIIDVCHGTACHVAGAVQITEAL